MLQGILGIKRGMTQVFDEDGKCIPVTVIEAGPCRVFQVKTVERDGYEAVQLGLGEKKHTRVNKSEKGHAAGADVPSPKLLREFKLSGKESPQLGDEIKVDLFQVGDLVDVTGITKGKGFQGVVKRYGFRGGPGGHGSTFHRSTGSIGCRSYPGKIFKGKKMPGHMGVKRRTVQRMRVIDVDPEKNVILLQGSVPGHNYSFIEIRKTVKPRKK